MLWTIILNFRHNVNDPVASVYNYYLPGLRKM